MKWKESRSGERESERKGRERNREGKIKRKERERVKKRKRKRKKGEKDIMAHLHLTQMNGFIESLKENPGKKNLKPSFILFGSKTFFSLISSS